MGTLGYELNFDKKSKKFTHNFPITSSHDSAILEQVKEVAERFEEFTPFEEGRAIKIGVPVYHPLKAFGLDVKVRIKPYEFVKYNNMVAVKSHYFAELDDYFQFGNQTIKVKGTFRGIVANHLGSGAWVYEKIRFEGTLNGEQVNIVSDKNCRLLSKDKFHTDLISLSRTTTNLSENLNLEAELMNYERTITNLSRQIESLKSELNKEEKLISSDNQIPAITAFSNHESQTNAQIIGKVTDNVEVAEVTVNGEPVRLGSDGSFETSFYVPRNGKVVEIVAFDSKGNKATKSIMLEREEIQKATGPVFASLNPSGKQVLQNKDALALIIGVADYERTPAKAVYADKDAQTFYDYAMLKLGIPANNIKELVNPDASRVDISLAVKDWIARTIKQGKSDVYVYFAGHGLADQTGEEMYLLPADGEPRLLSDSAISRNKLFLDIASANPRSVTVFLDTCYSGTTRGTDMLIASRPIAIRAKQQNIPDGFTVFTAAGGDQTAKPLEEAKHGMFSYFLMKGMEGDADGNQDNQITAAELHEYVEQNVVQQSGGSQVPELQGDAERVLVRFQ